MTIRRRLAGLTSYAFAQGLAQVLAFCSGVLIVRALAKEDYGHYGLSVSLIAMLTFLADSGGTSVLMSRGASLLRDGAPIGPLFKEGARFRQTFGWGVAAAGSLVLTGLLLLNDATWWQTALYVVLVLASFIPILALGVTQTLHRLLRHVQLIQRTTLAVAAGRTALTLGVALSPWASVELFLLVNILCSSVTAVVYAVAARPELASAEPSRVYLPEFKSAAVRVFPMILLLIGGEQIYLLLIAWLSPPDTVGEALALSRFAVAFVVVNAAVSDIFAPWLARTGAVAPLIAKRFAVVLGAYIAASAAIVAAIGLAAPALLALLGAQYAGLEGPMTIFAAGYALFYVGLSWDSLNQGRGWIRLSWVYLPLLIVWAVTGLLMLDLARLVDVAIFFATLAVPMLITQGVRTADGLWRMRGAA